MMKDLNDTHYAWLRYLEQMHLTKSEPFLLLALLCAVLAIVLALLGILRARKSASLGGVARFSNDVQDLRMRFDDFVGRFNTNQTKLTEEVKQLRERLNRMESELSIGVRRKGEASSEPSQPAPTEKKTEKLGLAAEGPPPAAPVSPAVSSTPQSISEIPRPPVPELEPKASIRSGLEKTRTSFFSRLRSVFTTERQLSSELSDELEELLIASDLGVKTSAALMATLREQVRDDSSVEESAIRDILKRNILGILESTVETEITPAKRGGQPLVVLVVGVNGVGKTTTIAKLANRFQAKGAKVLLAAADTFRAAAVEQLDTWAKRVGIEVVMGQEGAKPTTVAFQAVHRAQEGNFDVVIIDTAGRLHTRVNLMNELGSICKIIEREQPGAPQETLLVLDATTGQNALQQAKEFHQLVKLSGIVITKLDGTPKGGIVVAIKDELGIPIRYVGVGEGIEDLRPFSAHEFVEALFAEDESGGQEALSARGKVRRRRREQGEELLH